MFALVSPSISSARLIAIAARCAIARATSVSSPVNGRRGGAPAHSRPSRSPPEPAVSRAGRRRRDRATAPSPAAVTPRPRTPPAASRSPTAPRTRRSSRARRTATRARWRRDPVGTPGTPLRPSSRRIPSVTAGPISPASPAVATSCASPDRLVSASTRRRCWSYSCAFSIAPDTSEAMWTSSLSVSSVNSRGASVWSTITPIVSPAREHDRNRHHRLEPLLVEDREELHPRVRHRAFADELGLAVAGHPPGQPLVEAHLHNADGRGVHRRGRPDRQHPALEQVDEARVATGRLGREVDDPLQHRAELDRRADEVDHPVEGAVLFAKPAGLSVADS